MAKNIVILNGSPRKTGNTAALVASFTKGAEENGNKVTDFFLFGLYQETLVYYIRAFFFEFTLYFAVFVRIFRLSKTLVACLSLKSTKSCLPILDDKQLFRLFN